MSNKILFSEPHVNEVFTKYSFSEFSTLMLMAAKGDESVVDRKTASDKIRKVMYESYNLPVGATRKQVRNAIRRCPAIMFEIVEEIVPNLLVSGWGENPFFNQFVEIRNMANGSKNEFTVEDDTILTVSEFSGNHHDIFRQRLGEGESFSVKTSWYGVKIYAEYEQFMNGDIDWVRFVEKVTEAFNKKINDVLYTSVMASGDKVLPTSQFTKTGALSASTKDTFLTLIEDVQAATGNEVVIMGTKSALSQLRKMADVDWIGQDMKNELYHTGRLGLFEGTKLAEIPQVFAPNDTSKKLVDNTKLLIMPMSAEGTKFVKLVMEDDAQVSESTDKDKNKDMTIEYEYSQRMGVATVIGKKFGTWKITA